MQLTRSQAYDPRSTHPLSTEVVCSVICALIDDDSGLVVLVGKVLSSARLCLLWYPALCSQIHSVLAISYN